MTKQIDSTWIFDSFADYYDAGSPAVQRNIARLADLEGEAFAQATYSIGAGVFSHASSLDDDVLPKAGATFADHLYRFGCSTEAWDDATDAYVRAVWGLFFSYLSERGFRIRYVVENTWADGLARPLELFPALYSAAGIVYLCPHVVALDLPEGQEAPRTLQGLRPMIAESRLVAATVAEAINETGRGHICFLEADFDEGSLDAVRGMTPEPGTIEIFRNQPPLPGTKIELRINRPQHVPNGTAGMDSSANVGASGAGKGSLAAPDEGHLQGAGLKDGAMTSISRRNADLSQTDLSGADLSGEDLSGAKLQGAKLKSAKLIAANLSGVQAHEANFDFAEMNGADLTGADLTGAEMIEADLSEADLSDANMASAWLGSTDLRNASLRNANLGEAWMRGTNLSGADLTGADLTNVILIKAKMTGASLCDAVLTGSNMKRADLVQADLEHAVLARVNLRRAIVRGANLRWADLTGSNLRRADLRGADLRGADLTGARMWRADLTDVCYDDDTKWPSRRYPKRPSSSLPEPGVGLMTANTASSSSTI